MSVPATLRAHPIRAAALAVVAATMIFIGYQQISLTTILTDSSWCARAINAERLIDGRQTTSCGDLLKRQVKAIALNSHIYAGTTSLGLLVLIVIVLAQGRLGFTAGKSGISANMGREEAADAVAEAAVDEAEAIKAGQ